MHLFDALYGRRIRRRPAEDPARPVDLRPFVAEEDSRSDDASAPQLILEVLPRAAPAARWRRGRGVPRSKPKA